MLLNALTMALRLDGQTGGLGFAFLLPAFCSVAVALIFVVASLAVVVAFVALKHLVLLAASCRSCHSRPHAVKQAAAP